MATDAFIGGGREAVLQDLSNKGAAPLTNNYVVDCDASPRFRSTMRDRTMQIIVEARLIGFVFMGQSTNTINKVWVVEVGIQMDPYMEKTTMSLQLHFCSPTSWIRNPKELKTNRV